MTQGARNMSKRATLKRREELLPASRMEEAERRLWWSRILIPAGAEVEVLEEWPDLDLAKVRYLLDDGVVYGLVTGFLFLGDLEQEPRGPETGAS